MNTIITLYCPFYNWWSFSYTHLWSVTILKYTLYKFRTGLAAQEVCGVSSEKGGEKMAVAAVFSASLLFASTRRKILHFIMMIVIIYWGIMPCPLICWALDMNTLVQFSSQTSKCYYNPYFQEERNRSFEAFKYLVHCIAKSRVAIGTLGVVWCCNESSYILCLLWNFAGGELTLVLCDRRKYNQGLRVTEGRVPLQTEKDVFKD